MKTKIFNSGKGWYISCTNYKDKEDKAYLNLFFPKDSEPTFDTKGKSYCALDIDVLEARFTSYKGRPGMTIFKYTVVEEKEDSKMFGGPSLIGQDDLPFY